MKRIVVCFWVLLMLVGPAQAGETISLVSVDWQPYAGELLPEYGVGPAIIAEACRRAGLEPVFHFKPWKRAMEDTAAGKYDALFSAYSSKSRKESYAISKPYLYGKLVLCAKKSRNVAWDGTIESLRPYRLGVVLGYVNTPLIDKDQSLKKDIALSDLLNLKKLLSGRLDAVVIDQFQAVYLLKNSPVLAEGLKDVDFLHPALGRKGIHLLFSKKNPGWRDRLARFNKGLEEIEQDGTKESIMVRFGFLLPDEGE